MRVPIRFLLIITLCLPFMLSAQGKIDSSERLLGTVVIDAGHGGKDPGCVWGDYKEKTLNLNVALLLGDMIEAAYPDVQVIYTRTDDRFIELYERGDIANRAGADLFISIHTDAVGNTSAHGNSTYIMGNDKAEKNLAVAQRENSVIVMESDYEAKYEGYDPGSAESFIIFSLMQYAHSEQSMVFAELVQKHYAKNTPIVDRGARQAPYLVLWRTAMPSVLTEIGFLTNANDRAYLVSEKGQKEVAKALFDAFSEYRTLCNTKAGEAAVEIESEQKEQPAATASQPTATVSQPALKSEAPQVVFYVQLCTLSKESNPNADKFGRYKGRIVQRQTPTGKWRCMVEAKDLKDAQRMAAEAQSGFKGAFVVAFQGDEYLSVAEAQKRLNR